MTTRNAIAPLRRTAALSTLGAMLACGAAILLSPAPDAVGATLGLILPWILGTYLEHRSSRAARSHAEIHPLLAASRTAARACEKPAVDGGPPPMGSFDVTDLPAPPTSQPEWRTPTGSTPPC